MQLNSESTGLSTQRTRSTEMRSCVRLGLTVMPNSSCSCPRIICDPSTVTTTTTCTGWGRLTYVPHRPFTGSHGREVVRHRKTSTRDLAPVPPSWRWTLPRTHPGQSIPRRPSHLRLFWNTTCPGCTAVQRHWKWDRWASDLNCSL